MTDFGFYWSETVELDRTQEAHDMVGIKIKMPKACVYENEEGKTEYCPICNHDDVPYCQYLDDDEVGIAVYERPCYCPLVEIKEHTPERTETWIPTSEQLPQSRQSVIISTKEWTGEGCYLETTEHHVIWKGYRWNATYWDDEVTAWMPLPKAYKEQ